MKTKYLLIIVLAFLTIILPEKLHACDACGCAVSGGYFGILPQYKRNLIGMRHSYQKYNHPLENGKRGFDYLHTTELQGRWYPNKKVQVIGVIPYSFRKRVENDIHTNISGVGDIRFMVSYFIFNSGDSVKNIWKNTFQVGSGIKLPTGKYMQRRKDLTILPMGFQTGNGAWGLPISLLHTVRHKSWGLTTDVQYWMNGINELSYQTGNYYGLSSKLFYWRNLKKWNILSSFGLSFWKFETDREYGKEVINTGGMITKVQSGIDIFNRKCAFHLVFQPPLKQNIPKNQPAIKTDFQIGFSWFL